MKFKIMTVHEKSLLIIETLNLSSKQVAEITGKAISTVHSKKKGDSGNKFIENDYEKLKMYALSKIEDIYKMVVEL